MRGKSADHVPPPGRRLRVQRPAGRVPPPTGPLRGHPAGGAG